MIRFSRFVLSAAVLTLALAPVLASAQPHHRGGHFGGHGARGHHGPGSGLLGIADQLDLTEDQQEQVEGIFSAHREATEALRQSHREAKRAVAEQIHSDVFDEIAIRQASERAAAFDADLAVERAQVLQDVRKVLTAEQLAELENLQERRKERKLHRRSSRRGHGSEEG